MSGIQEELRSFRGQEGVDFIRDPYAVAGVQDRSAPRELIENVLRQRLSGFPSARRGPVTDEPRTRAERMVPLLCWASGILLYDDTRRAYDDLLFQWEDENRPVHDNDSPALLIEDAYLPVLSRHSPEEVEAYFLADYDLAVAMYGYDPELHALHADMYEATKTVDKSNLTAFRCWLEDDLLAYDNALAWNQEHRSRSLWMYGTFETINLEHSRLIRRGIAEVRTVAAEEYRWRLLGGISAELARLSGSDARPIDPGLEIIASGGFLPWYFDSQADEVIRIAELREEILRKRLEIFEPDYPVEDIQVQARPSFVVGELDRDNPERCTWVEVRLGRGVPSLGGGMAKGELLEMLEAGAYEQVYASGHNIVTFQPLDHIDPNLIFGEACNKYQLKFGFGI